MRISAAISLLLLSTTSGAADRKAIEDVDSGALTTESQVVQGTNNTIDMAWWISSEFWEVSLGANPSIQDFQMNLVLDTLQPYSVIAIVQADISDFGAFTFYGEERIANGMLVEHIDEHGSRTVIPHDEGASPDVTILLNQMVPVLAAAMGNMGENFYFFPLPNFDAAENRLISPYEKGTIRVTLDTRENSAKSVIEIQLPLDALHIPRLCANGKPAHVSWTHCPWGGEKLN